MQTEGVNGFSTLDLYESTDFHLYFQKEKSQIAMKKNNDYGIGMTAALENLLWAPA